jgi:hypothetical protein
MLQGYPWADLKEVRGMAKKPTQKQILEAAAKKAATKVLLLEMLIPIGRHWQTVERRAKIYLEAFKVRIVRMMRRHQLDQTHGKKSLATLVPDLKMKKDAEGAWQYRRLVRRYGPAWAQRYVRIRIRQIPGYEVQVQEKVGRSIVDCDPEVVGGYTETLYYFCRRGTPQQELEWTEALGNRITARLTGITAAYAAGLPRNAHKKK